MDSLALLFAAEELLVSERPELAGVELDAVQQGLLLAMLGEASSLDDVLLAFDAAEVV